MIWGARCHPRAPVMGSQEGRRDRPCWGWGGRRGGDSQGVGEGKGVNAPPNLRRGHASLTWDLGPLAPKEGKFGLYQVTALLVTCHSRKRK